MIKIDTLTVKNFMSVGNQTQAVHLGRDDLTLVLGENYDVGGSDAGARNGTGKTTIINALSYALYGIALTNIKKDNLINKTNSKGMLVTVEFEKNNTKYRIERGRKPNVLKLFVGEFEHNQTDEAQGDSRETQAEIEEILGLSHNMFKHILALNTYNEPFLSMRQNDQREIIEQLLGITQLSEKAENLKEQIKRTKGLIQEEEYRINAVQDANKRIEDQIKNLERRQSLWNKKHQDDVSELENAIQELNQIDIDQEIENHRLKSEYNEKIAAKAETEKWINSITKSYTAEENRYLKLEKEITDIENHQCYACGTKLHDNNQQDILAEKIRQRQESSDHMLELQSQANEYEAKLESIGEIADPPTVFYKTANEANQHRTTVSTLEQQLESKRNDTDPYTEQINEMRAEALQAISWELVNELNNLKEHQEFLLKLLTNKDSFIRKRIIDQNLFYLNTRLDNYLQQIGLPHTVEFKNDLSVEIQELGRDLDFDNLSRGERTRLMFCLSLSFRDVWENLYQKINILVIDELLDNGLDSVGIENAVGILKHKVRTANNSIWLVSHREELSSRVNNIFMVIKENGFTSFGGDEIRENLSPLN